MKYGIQIVHENGDTTYAYAAKGGYIQETVDITDIALFVQKDSAVKALKAARKNGYEVEGTSLQVVGITLTVSEITEIDKPVVKAGHVLFGLDAECKEVYYGGMSYRGPDWYNVERATIFKSDTEASLKLRDIKDWYANKLVDKTNVLDTKRTKLAYQKANQHMHHNYYDRVSDYDLKYAEDDVEKAKAEIHWAESIQVVFNQ